MLFQCEDHAMTLLYLRIHKWIDLNSLHKVPSHYLALEVPKSGMKRRPWIIIGVSFVTAESGESDESLSNSLVQTVSRCVSRELLLRFIRCFLLESNATAVRWQAHALILHIYRYSTSLPPSLPPSSSSSSSYVFGVSMWMGYSWQLVALGWIARVKESLGATT